MINFGNGNVIIILSKKSGNIITSLIIILCKNSGKGNFQTEKAVYYVTKYASHQQCLRSPGPTRRPKDRPESSEHGHLLQLNSAKPLTTHFYTILGIYAQVMFLNVGKQEVLSF